MIVNKSRKGLKVPIVLLVYIYLFF